MSKKCIVCGNQVDWTKVQEEFEHVLDQVDCKCEESLTEHQQVVYMGLCCSHECYERLD